MEQPRPWYWIQEQQYRELVADDKKRLGKVTLRDTNGSMVQRDKVKVEIKVAGFTFTQVVALTPGETVDNMGLLSMTVDVEIAAKKFKHYFGVLGRARH